MNAFRELFAVIMTVLTAIANMLVKGANAGEKAMSAVERGASSLDKLAEAGEIKATNFTKLVKLNDEYVYEERHEQIQELRKKYANLSTDRVPSEQEKYAVDLSGNKKA